MVSQERKREDLAGAEDNIFQKYLDQVTDFAMKLLNLKPKDTPQSAKAGETKAPAGAPTDDIMAKAKELSKNAVKGIVNTGDSLLKSLKLEENEQVKKMTEDAKKFLKQMGLLEDEFQNEEYY